MDLAWKRREIRKLHLIKAAQVGASEAIRNILAFLAHREPDPVLLVLPDEKTGKKIMSKRILPLFEDTPCLAGLATDASRDQGLMSVLLANGFNLSLGWTGSPATMASDPARIVIWDETDKSAEWDGREAGVAELIDVRTATYENSLFVALSTPTTDDGPISVLSENAAVRLGFHCPCPHCGHYQVLSFWQVRYPHAGRPKPKEFDRIDDTDWQAIIDEPRKSRRASLVEHHRAGWYECIKCSGVILDHQRQAMLLAGCWATADLGYRLYVDGREEGEWPGGDEVAMHLPFLVSLSAKHKFYKGAAEWMKCEGDPQRTQGFYNSWLGETFKIQVKATTENHVRQKASNAPPPMVVPGNTVWLFATADVQGNDPATGYFYYVIRAWSWNYESQLVDYGIVNTFEELHERCLVRPIPFEGGGHVVPSQLLIDAGNRANEVYQFALQDPARIKPTKGASTRLSWPVEKRMQKQSGVILWHIDTDQTKDLLNRLMHDPDPQVWRVHRAINDDYCQQLTAETKVFERKLKREAWRPKTQHAPNHLLDCEQQQCAAAYDVGAGMPKPEEQPVQQQAEQAPGRSWMNGHEGMY